MSKFEGLSDRITKSLALEWEPIALKFSDKPDGRGDSSSKLRVCEAFDSVRRENEIINFSKPNCVCPGGRHYLGLEILPVETVAAVWTKAHKAYESMGSAIISVNQQPQPIKRGDYAILGPLKLFEAEPDLVIVFANAQQADRALALASFRGAEPFAFYPISNACSCITYALAKGQPEINFLAVHTRRMAKWSPNELVVAMPFRDFEAAVSNIPSSGYGTAQMEKPKL